MRIFDLPTQSSLPRKTVVAVTLAAVVGATVTATGAVSQSGALSDQLSTSDAVELTADELPGPSEAVAERSAAAATTDAAADGDRPVVMKAASATVSGTVVSGTVVSGTSPSAAKATAKSMVLARGWGSRQYRCLVTLWQRESNWNYRATNRSSGAYGLAQALPGRKMASAGSDWRNNPATQIRWGLGYIAGRYRTPCGALAHSRATGWY